MKRRYLKHFPIYLILILIIIGSQLSAVSALPVQDEITVLSTGSHGITFEISVPWQILSLEPIFIESQVYTQVSLPGWTNTEVPGAPQLPFSAQIIGVPHDAEITIRVTHGNPHSYSLDNPVFPGGTQLVSSPSLDQVHELTLPAAVFIHEPDPQIYHSHKEYPGILAEVLNRGTLRQQQIASIAAYPVQYQPDTNSLIVYETLQVEVFFGPATYQQRFTTQPDSALFEALLQDTLLNYEDAQLWRQPAEVEYLTEAVDPQHLTMQRDSGLPWFPPTPAWKIPITEEGFYQLTYSDLLSAGILDGDPDPANFQLFYLGEEVAIEVITQDASQFADGDTLRFYGLANPTKYTRETIYWLTIGSSPGARMNSRDGTPGSADIPLTYPAQRHFEENKIYYLSAPGEDALDRFTWAEIQAITGPKDWRYNFSISAVMPGSANLTLALIGLSSIAQVNPDHHAEVFINDIQVTNLLWDGRTWQIADIDITGLLVEGDNQLRVNLPHDTGAQYDVVHVDWFTLNYQRAFTAENNQLTFDYDQTGTWLFEIDGFTSDQLMIYDLTNPFAVTKIINSEIDSQDSTYTVGFEDVLGSPKRYALVATSENKSVNSIDAVLPTTFQPGPVDPEYLIISHRSFWDAAQTLAAHRSAEMSTLLVDVQDVYNHFAYGQVGVLAIRNFLAYAYMTWGSTYVLLIGDGHYDPNNYLGDSPESFIPPYLSYADPWIGETATDNRFVTFTDGNNLPNIMIGRLSVNTTQEAEGFIDKIITYEHADQEGWLRQILAVADDADGGGNYPLISDNIIKDLVPFTYTVERVYYQSTHPTVAATRDSIQAGINSGKFLVSYFGHGAFTFWANESLFTTADVSSLYNGPRYPIVLAMTCYEGYFHRPKGQVLAEVVTNTPGKGAVASWSPSGLGISPGHNHLARGFYQAVFTQEVNTLGEATLAGKLRLWASGSVLDLLDTYNLFGDPALRFHPQPVYKNYLPLFTR